MSCKTDPVDLLGLFICMAFKFDLHRIWLGDIRGRLLSRWKQWHTQSLFGQKRKKKGRMKQEIQHISHIYPSTLNDEQVVGGTFP